MLFTTLFNGNNMAEMEQSLGGVVNGDVIYHVHHSNENSAQLALTWSSHL